MKAKKPTIRIQLVVSQEINGLLNTLAEKERKTRSVIAELAIQAYSERGDASETLIGAKLEKETFLRLLRGPPLFFFCLLAESPKASAA